MKTQDLFSRPIINLTNFASVDVSKFLHAEFAKEPHTWTFIQSGGDGSWQSIQRGMFNEASRNAVKHFCVAFKTKYARLVLVSMEPIKQQGANNG